MNIQLPGHNVLVTGGASGIGRAIAEAFTHAGANVVINYLEHAQAAQKMVADGFVSAAIKADVSCRDDVLAMIETLTSQHGPVQTLVNCAGISNPTPFLDITEQDWDRTFAVNLKGAMFCSQAVIPGMLEQGEGNIINVASELGYLGRAGFSSYAASKAALINLTRSLALEFAPALRINAVAPGPVMTDLLRGEINTDADLQAEQNNPMRRVAEPEEIAGSVVFLASSYASFYCGDVLSPNGGVLMR